MGVIITEMCMPKRCTDCNFYKGCESPKKFPFVECMFIGNLGSMFNVENDTPVECPLRSVEELIEKINEQDFTQHDGNSHWYMTPPEIKEIVCGMIEEYCGSGLKERH